MDYNEKTINTLSSRIVSCLFKADAYISILRGRPPNIYYDELDVSLPHTFAHSNSEGLDVFYRRLLKEPPDRIHCKLSGLASGSIQLGPSVLLIEDIQTGLCGLFQRMWRHNILNQIKPIDLCSTNDLEALSFQLDAWETRLDKIVVSCTAQAEQDMLEHPLHAYLGFEDESKTGWKSSVLNRVKAFAQETAIIYHLLTLQIEIGRYPWLCRLILSDLEGRSRESSVQTDLVSSWKQSKDGRKALAHSAAITRTLVLALSRKDPSNVFLPSPITSLAFSISTNVIRFWAASPEGVCTCNKKDAHIDIDLNHLGLYRGNELQEWFENGGPPTVGGIPFCKCVGDIWFARIEALL